MGQAPEKRLEKHLSITANSIHLRQLRQATVCDFHLKHMSDVIRDDVVLSSTKKGVNVDHITFKHSVEPAIRGFGSGFWV